MVPVDDQGQRRRDGVFELFEDLVVETNIFGGPSVIGPFNGCPHRSKNGDFTVRHVSSGMRPVGTLGCGLVDSGRWHHDRKRRPFVVPGDIPSRTPRVDETVHQVLDLVLLKQGRDHFDPLRMRKIVGVLINEHVASSDLGSRVTVVPSRSRHFAVDDMSPRELGSDSTARNRDNDLVRLSALRRELRKEFGKVLRMLVAARHDHAYAQTRDLGSLDQRIDPRLHFGAAAARFFRKVS